ncbi:Dihydrolipoamide acetyltransferase component of pyruvate dehydrogenase complex [Rhynchospora pubera]|uniref:Dihydrolipoamide acetyltransferase component of pyruvate dehydrogenase complex n=1 Tax=Rhynchospora pubera TaxID=906938 RepID=A0AAV8BTW0_9POAL|nr:Dihydrolipoamide acetyltransferase component of pyruvate dehydrogenase complex [Rhynchospora pubera]
MATSHLASSFTSSQLLPVRRLRAVPRRARVPAVQAKIREIFMPALSSTMTEGKIVSWHKSEGDWLTKGESVVVVESDKADMDVETFYDGFLAAIVVPEGESAPVGAAIAFLAETEEEVPLAKAKADSNSSGGGSAAPAAVEIDGKVAAAPAAVAVPAPAATAVADGPRKTVATPHAKKLAKQHKVDINKVVGTGPYGRITPADIEAAAGIQPKKPAPAPVAQAAAAPATPAPAAAASASLPPPLPGSSVVPFTTMQGAVSKNMMESLSVPTFRVGYPIVTDALDALYAKLKPKGVTMTVILAKAAAMALAQHPVVNASCKDGKSFSYNGSINIAVAVAMDGGLITPVLQDADKLDLYLLSEKWKELVKKARAKQLSPNEYNSGTFTLSNLGMFGVDRFDAILPPGQGAIMAVGASKPTVVADKDGFFSVKSKMLVNVTADHRIIYGADLAAFLETFAKIVENPDNLTL